MTLTFSQAHTSAGILLQSSVSAFFLSFFHQSFFLMIPFIFVSVTLIAIDLLEGIKAARHRHERVTFSRGFRMTVNKIVEYFCWIILGATATVAWNIDWLNYAVMGAVAINEIASIIGNRLEMKGIKLLGVGKAIIDFIGRVITKMSGVEFVTDGVEIEGARKPEEKRTDNTAATDGDDI